MRAVNVAVVVMGVAALPAAAQEAFDACEVFTPVEASAILGTVAVETPQFKGKRPKVVMQCTYSGSKDGKHVAALAQFRFARSDAEMREAFAAARLELQTKPMLIAGNEGFWSARTGQLYFRKGRAQVTLAVGPDKATDRDMETARKLAETIAKKL